MKQSCVMSEVDGLRTATQLNKTARVAEAYPAEEARDPILSTSDKLNSWQCCSRYLIEGITRCKFMDVPCNMFV